jgi:hypothetical protein
MTLAASVTCAYAKEKGVSGRWTLSAEGYVLELVLAQSGAARRSFRQSECFNQTARSSASSRARRRAN